MIPGQELTRRFEENLKMFNIKVVYEKVEAIKKEGKIFRVKTTNNVYFSKTVIIATGKKPRSLGVPGEDKLLGKGITYYAIYDAPFFKDKPVAIIGGGNSALQAVLELARFTKEIYVINLASKLTADEILQDRVKELPFVKIFNNSKVARIKGEERVEAIEFMDVITKEIKELKVAGVVVEIGLEPSIEMELPERLKMNEKGEIDVDQNCYTSVPGLFAAGDVTDVKWKQIVIAAGEGAKAALSAYEYLTTTFAYEE